MKKIQAFLLFVLLPFCILRGQEPARYTVETVPQTEILSWSYVTDLSGVVSASQKDSLNVLCRYAKDSLRSEIAVVVLPAVDNSKYATLHEFGVELYNRWGIGGKESQKGLLIALTTAPGEREVSFITGYGMEGVLPDAICKRIQTQIMIPYMKDGEYGGGLIAGVEAVSGILRGDVDADPYSDDSGMAVFGGAFSVALCLLLAIIIYVKVSNVRKRRKMGRSITCRGCGVTGDMKYVRSDIISPATTRQSGIVRHTYVCRHCSEENYVDEVIPRRPSGGNSGFGGGGVGPIVGGGRSFGGGSFGSFGGGLSGGGGASTRF